LNASKSIVVLYILPVIVPPEMVPWRPKTNITLILDKPLLAYSKYSKLLDYDLLVLDPKLVVY
jgi:hypothetical protein